MSTNQITMLEKKNEELRQIISEMKQRLKESEQKLTKMENIIEER